MRTFIVALCCVVLMSACRTRHNTEAYYSTRIDAEHGGEFNRGWLPDFLPATSRAIYLAYDVSPSEEWCAFNFDVAETDALLSHLTVVDPLASPTKRVPRPGVDWWPRPLEGNLDAERIRANGLVLYSAKRPLSRVQDENLIFAIDSRNGRGYFYGR